MALDIIAKAKAKGVNLVLGSDLWLLMHSLTMLILRLFLQIIFLTDGKVWMQVLKLRKHLLLLLKMPRLFCGTVLPVFLNSITLLPVLRAIAEAIAKATKNQSAFSLIGGGDSVACINKFGMADQFLISLPVAVLC